ncbi:MAG: hypothetical protein KJ963_00540 [Bacteroidetes bacterium]|nr:hypothetical protein [Bacteroidota bacterium]
MKTEDKIVFDELDVKCVESLPLVIEVLASTGNKIARVMSLYFDEISNYISEYLSTKKNWKIANKWQNYFYPFSRDYHRSTLEISELKNAFAVMSSLKCEKKIGQHAKNFFFVINGFEFDAGEDGYNPRFYFYIEKSRESERWGGVLNSRKFYEELKNENKKFRINIHHPELGDDYESIQIYCSEIDTQKIDEIYHVFKTNILTPFLKGIKY